MQIYLRRLQVSKSLALSSEFAVQGWTPCRNVSATNRLQREVKDRTGQRFAYTNVHELLRINVTPAPTTSFFYAVNDAVVPCIFVCVYALDGGSTAPVEGKGLSQATSKRGHQICQDVHTSCPNAVQQPGWTSFCPSREGSQMLGEVSAEQRGTRLGAGECEQLVLGPRRNRERFAGEEREGEIERSLVW